MRRLWIAAAVWVAFWSLYPTFGRPRAFGAALRSVARGLDACDPIPAEKARQECWQAAGAAQQRSLAAITLQNEYSGYASVGLGVGVLMPAVVLLGWMMIRRRETA